MNLVNVLLSFQNQFKILHWQTKSYARHMAYGGFYDSFSDSIDTFIEVHMGKYGRVDVDNHLAVKNMSEVHIDSVITELEHFLISLTGHYDSEKDTDLLNIRDDMLGQLNKLKYLLTLE